MKQPAARRAWERWQLAAGPWQGWTVCPALLSPELEDVPRTRPALHRLAQPLATRIAPLVERDGTLCVLDLEPELGVQVAARLASFAHPVLVLPRWPYARAVLPVDRLLATILAEAQHLPPAPERHASVVFVVDAQRQTAIPRRPAADRRADNRYHLAAFDLPDLRTLRQRGIRRIERVAHT